MKVGVMKLRKFSRQVENSILQHQALSSIEPRPKCAVEETLPVQVYS